MNISYRYTPANSKVGKEEVLHSGVNCTTFKERFSKDDYVFGYQNQFWRQIQTDIHAIRVFFTGRARTPHSTSTCTTLSRRSGSSSHSRNTPNSISYSSSSHSQRKYRVTHHVDSNLPLTPKQKLSQVSRCLPFLLFLEYFSLKPNVFIGLLIDGCLNHCCLRIVAAWI